MLPLVGGSGMKYCVKYHDGRRHPSRAVAGTYTQQAGGAVVHCSVGK